MKTRSVITPPPEMPVGEGNTAFETEMSEEQRKEALLKLVRKGAPSVAPKEGAEEKELNERVRYSVRLPRPVLERVTRAAEDRDVKIPVNTWINEAILLQLKKEGM